MSDEPKLEDGEFVLFRAKGQCCEQIAAKQKEIDELQKKLKLIDELINDSKRMARKP